MASEILSVLLKTTVQLDFELMVEWVDFTFVSVLAEV